MVIKVRRPGWRGSQTEATWRRSFKRYVFPIVGDIPVDKVTIKDVTKIVEPHWLGRGSAGYLVRHRLDAVLRRAVILGYRADNPAHQLLDVLPGAAATSSSSERSSYAAAVRSGGSAGFVGARGCEGRSRLHRFDGRSSV